MKIRVSQLLIENRFMKTKPLNAKKKTKMRYHSAKEPAGLVMQKYLHEPTRLRTGWAEKPSINPGIFARSL